MLSILRYRSDTPDTSQFILEGSRQTLWGNKESATSNNCEIQALGSSKKWNIERKFNTTTSTLHVNTFTDRGKIIIWLNFPLILFLVLNLFSCQVRGGGVSSQTMIKLDMNDLNIKTWKQRSLSFQLCLIYFFMIHKTSSFFYGSQFNHQGCQITWQGWCIYKNRKNYSRQSHIYISRTIIFVNFLIKH